MVSCSNFGRSRLLEGCSYLLNLVALDDVAGLVAVEIIKLDAALEAGADFVGVVLEALERGDLSFVYDLLPATKAGGNVAIDLSLGDETAGHKTLGQREYLADFRLAGFRFLEIRI